MSRFDFAQRGTDPGADPAERMLQRWVQAHGGSGLLAEAVSWTRRAEARGDSCLALAGTDAGRHGAPVWDAEARAALAAEVLVGNGQSITPFVLDAQQRFYFLRNWTHEQTVAAHILARLHSEDRARPTPAGLIERLFADTEPGPSELQRRAVESALQQRLLVLTGGPGTGKTSTVLRLLLAQRLLARAQAQALRIRLAAPTGKAAQRLTEALRLGAGRLANHLPADAQEELQALLEIVPATVHRLLGYQPANDRFAYGREHRLDADLVLVDEASMLDIATLAQLLDAVPDAALLVLVGDADQLTPVAAGSALDDIVRALHARGSPRLVRLQHGFRSEQRLQDCLAAVLAGDPEQFQHAAAAAGAHVRQRPQQPLGGLLQAWCDRLDPILGELRGQQGEAAASRLAQAWQRNQLLCALREGPFGAVEVARRIDEELRRRWGVVESQAWYAGQALLIRRNDYGRALFNGDVGVVLPDAQGTLRVWFAGSERDTAALRSFAPADLPAHDSASALTVHRSQGSEYERIALLLPPDPDSPILSRQLVYTALSRARQQIEIWARPAEFDAALARRIHRVGGLYDALLRGPA